MMKMMKRLKWRFLDAVSLVMISGLAYGLVARGGLAKSPAASGIYVCPLTGDELPCPNCCPLKP